MMPRSRAGRGPVVLHGPVLPQQHELAELNDVFSESFSDRYRRDGMVGVRVPHLNPQIWRYAIEDAGGGAMLWRDARGAIAAFNMVHLSGTEGWMGPLAVRPDLQGTGAGRQVVMAGVEWLRAAGAAVIGLETMPRTMDNIGFYSRLGFLPGAMTITLSLDASRHDVPYRQLERLAAPDRSSQLDACRTLLQELAPGYDFTREIELTAALELGDTLLWEHEGRLAGFVLTHSAPLVQGRGREELRVLKLVLRTPEQLPTVALALRDLARRLGTRRVAFRVQGQYASAYSSLVSMGAMVRWTDLRMTLSGVPEPVRGGLVLSNWEI
jgi:GNAT superfamily N-acetyltransferase